MNESNSEQLGSIAPFFFHAHFSPECHGYLHARILALAMIIFNFHGNFISFCHFEGFKLSVLKVFLIHFI